MRRKNKRLLTSTYHITFSVERRFNTLVRKVSSEIHKKYNTKFVVDGKEYNPHLTMYLFAAPIANQKKIISTLIKIAPEFKLSVLKVKKLFLSYDGWLMIYLDNKVKLGKYHETIIDRINPLREGVQRKKYRGVNKILQLPNDERLSLMKYGDRHAIKYYYPHLSLTKFDNLEDAEEALINYRKYFQKNTLKIVSLDLIRDIKDGSDGIGRLLYRYKY